MIEFDVVDSLVVRIESEVGSRRAEGPDFDRAIETGGSEGVGIFWVEGEVHDVVRVTFEDLACVIPSVRQYAESEVRGERGYKTDLNAFPRLLPVPELDRHIV